MKIVSKLLKILPAKDVYDESKELARINERRDEEIYSYLSTVHKYKSMSIHWVWVTSLVVFFVSSFLFQVFRRLFARLILSFTGAELGRMTFGSILLMRHHTMFTLLLSFILTIITAVMMYSVYKSQKAVDEAAKELIDGDVNSTRIESPYVLLEKFDYIFDTTVWRKGYKMNKQGELEAMDLSITSIITHMPIADSMMVRGRDGNVRFNKKFMEDLFDIAKVGEKGRQYFDSSRLRYNPKNSIYGKSYGDTLADSINATAYVPDCERIDPDNPVEDPAGIYIVSTAPENTIIVTETRGGKGQKYIEAMIDGWSRIYNQPNIVATDLKMELLRMSLRTLTYRGYNVKSLNLLVPTKTDAINFIGYALESAIRGDINEMEATITTIADIYFPKDAGNDNPMWQNAASAVFKRTIMGLIDYICEEVAEMKLNPKLTPGEIRQRADELYGKVTLFNAYRFVVSTSSTQYSDPDFIHIDPDDQSETKTGMTLFFDATDKLYRNSIRSKIANNDRPIRTVADSERMLASIYGIALFGMIFFTDDRVIRLTSARPSENLDMTGFAFPRRFAVRFDLGFAQNKSILGDIAKWSCYEDPEMKKPFLNENGRIDKDFIYDVGTIDIYGWANAVFKGIFPNRTAYIKLEIFGSDNGLKSYTYNFVFKKDYRKSYTGHQILNNPISHEPEVQGGTLAEYQLIDVEKRDPVTKKLIRDEFGKPVTEKKVQIMSTHNTVFKKSLILTDDPDRSVEYTQRVITDVDVRYAEKPTALFLVAPPNFASYNKILLITIDLLYGKQTSLSYITNSNQKPFYETKYMLDEFGNIQSEGKGVPMLDSKLSAGLGQSQQFTLILQALKQIDALYGAEKAETIKGSVKKYMVMSTKDEDTINTLMGMNGEKFTVQKTSQTNDKPIDLFFNNLKVKGSVSETRSRDITNILSKNDFLRLNEEASDGRAIVVTGNNPIVSAGPLILPMSYRLQAKRLGGRGDDIPVQNPPTMASTLEFDPLRNIPDFESWLKVRVAQAKLTPKVVERYKQVYGYTDLDLERLNADIVAAEIMHGVNQNLAIQERNQVAQDQAQIKAGTKGIAVGKPFNHGDYRNDHLRDQRRDNSYANQHERREVTERAQHGLEVTSAKVQHVMDESNMSEIAVNIRSAALERERLKEQSDEIAKIVGDLDKGSKVKRQLSDEEAFGEFNQEDADAYVALRYVDNHWSRSSLITQFGNVDPNAIHIIASVYDDLIPHFRKSGFTIKSSGAGGPNSLYGKDGKLYIEDEGNNVYDVKSDFVNYIIGFDSWDNFLGGQFESAIRHYMKQNGIYIDPNLLNGK